LLEKLWHVQKTVKERYSRTPMRDENGSELGDLIEDNDATLPIDATKKD
jgi:DNA-directed RNA polymerase sigma subunit (sigma70/sigma32)